MKLVLLPFLLFITTLLSYGQENLPLKRFGLFIGANDGGWGRARLKYAISDAEGMAEILHDLGGLDDHHSIILRDPGSREIWQGFDSIEQMLQSEKPTARRVEFIFYYSGHADEQGFLLGSEHLRYSEIRERLGKVGADVKIAIIDSCSSGAFTRTKGGTSRSPFLIDESNRMQGHAYLTSSSEDEFSQESDTISGSFFTHYLQSGLRGAADSTRDGKVTLNELYEHAFTHTLNRTESTSAGPQHPSYEIQLTGTGDLVLSDLSRKSSTLVLSPELSGKVFVRSISSGRLIAEFVLRGNQDLTLALEPGEYRIQLNQDENSLLTQITLKNGDSIRIKADQFEQTHREISAVRGDQPEENVDLVNINIRIANPFTDIFEEEKDDEALFHLENLDGHPELSFLSGGVTRLMNLPVVPGFMPPEHTLVSLSPLLGWEKSIIGAQLAAIGASSDHGVFGGQIAGIFAISKGDFIGGQLSGIFSKHQGDFLGAQLAGVFNHNGQNFIGAQLSGVFNYGTQTFLGAQLSGIFNRNEGEMKGAQIAGILNLSGDMRGLQLSGILNGAQELTGAQIGLINIADEAQGSLQLGLINVIGKGEGLPIGLINIGYDMGISYQGFSLNDYLHHELSFRTATTTLNFSYLLPIEGDNQSFLTKIALGYRGKLFQQILGVDVLGDIKVGLYSDEANWRDGSQLWNYGSLNPYLSLETSFQFGFFAVTLGLENGWYLPGNSSQSYRERQTSASWYLDAGGDHFIGSNPYFAIRLF